MISAEEQLLVIATDGLWDTLREEELRRYLGKPSEQVAKELVEFALANGSRDNVCVLAVCL
jgi:serine/threonine protein phosphatase PrpC